MGRAALHPLCPKEQRPNCDQPETTFAESCADFAALALERALKRLGEPVPRWGDLHQATFKHPVLTNVAPLRRFVDRAVPHGGDRYTVNRGAYDPANFHMTVGSSYRQILDFSDLERSLYIHPMGQSGSPLSGDFANLLPLWQRGEYLAMKTQDYPVQSRQRIEPLR